MPDKVFLDTNIIIYYYSEDMQHHQLIDGSLRIINPFV
ncbi:MAG: PIN domain-containing protein [Spirochaetes bacterium]|nr:PIN domain-containing protein [Spirochaetota bacterium]